MFNFYLIYCIYLYTYILFTLYTIYLSIYTYILSLSWGREALHRDEEFPDWILDHCSWYWGRAKKIKDSLKTASISQSFLRHRNGFCVHSPWIRAAPLTSWTNQIWQKWCSAGVQAQSFPDQQLLRFPYITRSYHVTSKDSMERTAFSWAQASCWCSRYLRPSKAACPPAEYHQGTPTQHLMEQTNCPVVSWALPIFLTHRSIEEGKNQTVAKFFFNWSIVD